MKKALINLYYIDELQPKAQEIAINRESMLLFEKYYLDEVKEEILDYVPDILEKKGYQCNIDDLSVIVSGEEMRVFLVGEYSKKDLFKVMINTRNNNVHIDITSNAEITQELEDKVSEDYKEIVKGIYSLFCKMCLNKRGSRKSFIETIKENKYLFLADGSFFDSANVELFIPEKEGL